MSKAFYTQLLINNDMRNDYKHGFTMCALKTGPDPKYNKTFWFGLQYYLKLLESIVVTRAEINLAKGVGNINEDAWSYIADVHNGVLPIEIRSIEEGYCVKPGVILMTVTNTDPACSWLPIHIESFLTQVWYATTLATSSIHVADLSLVIHAMLPLNYIGDVYSDNGEDEIITMETQKLEYSVLSFFDMETISWSNPQMIVKFDENHELVTVEGDPNSEENLLDIVFLNGKLYNLTTLTRIKELCDLCFN